MIFNPMSKVDIFLRNPLQKNTKLLGFPFANMD